MRWRLLVPLLILFIFALEVKANPRCARNLTVEDIFAHDLKLSPEAMAFLENIPQAKVYLDSFRRVFTSLTPENLKKLSFEIRSGIDPIYLYNVFSQPGWETGDYLTLSELLLKTPSPSPNQVLLEEDGPAGQPLPLAQVQRLNSILQNETFRQGLRSLMSSSNLPVLVAANVLELSDLHTGSRFNHETAELYRRYLDFSTKRLRTFAFPDGALRLYRKILRVYPLSLIENLDHETFHHVMTCLEGGKCLLNRRPLLSVLEPILQQLPSALEVIDYYYFATKPQLSENVLRAQILTAARECLQNWRVEYTRHLNLADAEAAKNPPLREIPPSHFEPRDFFPVAKSAKRIRLVANSQVTPTAEPAKIPLADDLARFDQDPQALKDLKPLKIYQFYILRPGHPGQRQVQFHPDAVAWLIEHPEVAKAFIHSILLGGTDVQRSAGIKKFTHVKIPGGGRALELKTVGDFRARVAMVNHVYQVLSFAHKDKMRTSPIYFRPIK